MKNVNLLHQIRQNRQFDMMSDRNRSLLPLWASIKDQCIILFMKITQLTKAKSKRDSNQQSTTNHAQAEPASPFKHNPNSLSKIPMPALPLDDPEKQLHSEKLPASKTNLKQLYHFLKNQIIVVRQKERFISNRPDLPRPSHLNNPLAKALSLKAEELPDGKVRTICLPKIEQDDFQKAFLDSSMGQREKLGQEQGRERSKCKRMFKNHGTRKRLSTISRHYNVDQSPLINGASRHISRERLRPTAIAKTKSITEGVSHDIIDFSLYRQCPQLSRVSLNLAIELSKSHQ